jgi:hypothetical protein
LPIFTTKALFHSNLAASYLKNERSFACASFCFFFAFFLHFFLQRKKKAKKSAKKKQKEAQVIKLLDEYGQAV